MVAEQSLPGFDDRSLPDRYCDLVLTGGVTSAVAYPAVIFGLAQAYRFNSIGGSSSGAGSAALAAAAEYRRRHGSSDGFRTMLLRTSKVADPFKGGIGLFWLFQPAPQFVRLFGALRPTFAGLDRSLRSFWCKVNRAYWLTAIFGIAVLALLIWALIPTEGLLAGGPWLSTFDGPRQYLRLVAALLIAIAAWQFAVGCCLWCDVKKIAGADADYGLCSGQQKMPGAPHEPLTAWLHDLIQDIAGLPPERPLTFADLESAPAGPAETLRDSSPAGRKSIDLRMFAANITLGRPLLLPLAESQTTLFFRPREFRRLFPDAVVDFMKSKAQSSAHPNLNPALKTLRIVMEADAQPGKRSDGAQCLRVKGEVDGDNDFYELPRADLPILVAARMSVSFPVLFSAVPLWECDPAGNGLRRMLIADGGLCSNFPIHFFDSMIPAWPTFGIALREGSDEASLDPLKIKKWVWLPGSHIKPPADRFSDFDARPLPLDRLWGFASAMASTVKDWNDTLMAELPGVRERVVQVDLPTNIGGLNILMKKEQIECLARLGGQAARVLLERFSSPDAGGAFATGWREHRWVRFNVLAECLQQSMLGLTRSAQFARYAEPIRDQIRRAIDEPPLANAGDPALRPAEAAALERTLDALMQIERALTPRTIEQPYKPVPPPELRIRPPL